MMTILAANELKTRGVSALEASLQQHDEVVISVRGKNRYVAMGIAHYNRLRELELAAAVAEARADYEQGCYETLDIAQHIAALNE